MIQMYIDGFGRRITASELSEYSGGIHWAADADEDLARSDVWHGPLEDVPIGSPEAAALGEDALEFARNLAETLDGATLPASEADTTGRIVIFADRGDDDDDDEQQEPRRGLPSVEVCSEALGLKEAITDRWDFVDDPLDLRAASWVTARNWALRIEKGFCYDETDEDDRHYDPTYNRGTLDRRMTELERILRTTAMMDAELVDHFEFNMSDEVICGPVLYGGRHGHSIVAVLGMRVWT